MSLLIGDDSPEGAEPQDWEKPAPAARGRPAPGRKRRDWSRWPLSRPRSMLIQDGPDPAEDAAADDYGAGDDYETAPYPRNRFFPGPGPGQGRYPGDRYDRDGYDGDGYDGDRYDGDRYDRGRLS